ncbi:hypothetical protein B566_EDAN013841 [Ephemera danica]|nr:hypothetical protein B566_EDAN013841 [Ephemera danica]
MMESMETWKWQEMCGSAGFIVWIPERYDFGFCFQALCLHIPLLVLLCALSSFFCGAPSNRIVRGKRQTNLLRLRCLVVAILAILPIAETCLLVIKSPATLCYVYYLLRGTQTITWFTHLGYCLSLISGLTVHVRGPVFISLVWGLNFLISIIGMRSSILLHDPANLSSNVCFVFSISMTVLHAIYLITLLPKKLDGAEIIYEETNPLLSTSTNSTYSRFREEVDPHHLGVAQEETSSFSNLLFHWVNPLMNKGVAGKINSVEDLFDLPLSLCTASISHRMQNTLRNHIPDEINRETTLHPPRHSNAPSLFKALHRCFGWQFYSIGILKFIADVAGFFGPMLLHGLVTFIENKNEPMKNGYMYAIGLFTSTAIAAFCNAHFNFLMSLVGLKIRAALVTTIYHKTLSLSITNLAKFSFGSIINFMSTDTDRIVNSCPSFHAFWSIPFQIAVSLYLLYLQVGLAFLAGVAFSIILIPINKCIASKIAELSTKLMTAKDERVKMMADMLHGMKVLKLHVWEDHFIRIIGKLRDNELKYLKGRKYLDALCVYFWATTPVLISILTFTTYALMGNELTAAKVFTSIALLNMLIAPLNAFPWVLNGLTEAWVSVKRIQKLLNVPQIRLEEYYSAFPGESEMSLIKVESASFQWGQNQENEQEQRNIPSVSRFQLKDIKFDIGDGHLVGVIGQVGSGKSSLLAALLAEMEKLSGVIYLENVSSGIGFIAQQPWLQRGTIRDNILFGSIYQHEKYKSVLKACCLDEEVQSLSGGDLTGVGEGGLTLSGGQRARVALARAVYQDKEIYLMDDILSAVDPNVAKNIFSKCILSLLKNKTRILCTHHRQFLQRKPEDVLDSCEQFLALKEEKEVEEFATDSESFSAHQSEMSEHGGPDVTSIADSLLNEEEREVGSVRFSVYKTYWISIGHLLGIAILLSLVLMQASRNLTDWWLSYWVTHQVPNHNSTSLTNIPTFIVGNKFIELSSPQDSSFTPTSRSNLVHVDQITFYLAVYGCIAGLNSIFTLFRAFLFAYGGVHAATSVHKKLLRSVIRAKAVFFDLTPVGRILNRFSSDTYTIDDSLPFIMNILCAQFFGLLGSLTVTVYGLPWLGLILLPMLPVYYWLQHYYRLTSRELKRISSVTLSPVYSHFNDTLQGLSTIRAFRVTGRFIHENEVHLENNQKSQFSSQAAGQWLNLRLQFIGVVLVGGVGLIAVVQHHFSMKVDPGLLGLAISYALSITGLLSGLVNAFTETEKEMIAVERAQQYIQLIEPEVSREVIAPPYAWPSQGVIIFHAVDMRYREHLAPCLTNVSFQTHPAEKIGIVGRTGAGKSSIFAALFRLTELLRGQILIDSVNIAHLSLRSLRVRENIDPLNEYSETEIWNALKRCHLDAVVTNLGGLDSKVGDRGKLLSVGQQQLLCLARAVLHNAKILCIDEATANVDKETDLQIQQTIKSSFFQSTVLTIAHRVQTVLDSDRVLVMGDGEVLEFDTPDNLLQNPDSFFYKMVYND